MKHPRPARDLALVVTVKVVLLTALFLLFFAPANRPRIDAASVAEHLLKAPIGDAP